VERGDLTGAILDARYRVIEPVGQGAMGTVYRAERIKLGRIVAIKVLHDVLPNELSGRKRFEIEAMAMAKLEHPHCASVLDVGVHSDRPYVVMDFVSGQNLKDLIAGGPQPIARAIDIVRQVLSGLAHAHELGIIHRDIKPANLVLSQKTALGDHVKILDFGLARLHDTGQNLTSGIVVGTPAYMAPEQIRGHQLDGRADLYACGVLLFELVTGQKPFHSEADDPIEVCRMHLKSPIPRLADKLPGVEFGELEAIAAKALAKDRDDRYASAQEFAAALDALAARRPSRPSLPPVPPSGPIQLGSGDLFAPDASYPPPVEVRTADVIAAIPDGAPDDVPSAVAPRRRASGPRRRRLLLLGGAALVIAVVAGAAIALRGRGAEPAGAAGRAAIATAPGAGGAADPVRDAIARATELTSQGDREAALDVLRRARRQSPDSAVLAYTLGKQCFAKFYWSEGLKSFRDAIRGDAAYRADPELIKTVLRGFITTPSYNEDLAGFLRDDIGAAAEPFLEETARDHPNPVIRSRAAAELHRHPGR
jgi:eukaryotic-like serine/threonine-protein kinase